MITIHQPAICQGITRMVLATNRARRYWSVNLRYFTIASGKLRKRSWGGEVLNTVKARGKVHTAVKAREGSAPMEVRITMKGMSKMILGSDNQARVRKKMKINAVLFVMRPVRSLNLDSWVDSWADFWVDFRK